MSFVAEFLKPDTLTQPKTILNVSTTIAHIRLPGLAPYGASKEAFVALLDHVQAEYKDKGVKIVSFHPGAVYTSMAKSAGLMRRRLIMIKVVIPCVYFVPQDADHIFCSRYARPVRALACVKGCRLPRGEICLSRVGF